MSDSSVSAREDDYYSSPESMSKLWAPRWLDVFKHGAWCSGEDPPPTGIDPKFDAYHPFACNVCKRGPFTGTVLLKCTKCRVARYCSREHQKNDWDDGHKRWCRAFANFRKEAENEYDDGVYEISERPDDIDQWRNCSQILSDRIVGEMSKGGKKAKGPRAVRLSAVHMTMGMPRCRKCLVSGVANVELTPCPRCGDVALCKDCLEDPAPASSDRDEDNGDKTRDDGDGDGGKGAIPPPHLQFHPDGGEAECDGHILCLSCTGMVVEQGSPICVASDTDCDSIFHPTDWADYLKKKRGDFHSVPKDLMMLMAPVIAFITDGLSIPLTILHTLCRPEVIGVQNVASMTRLVVHLVGALAVEEMSVSKYVELIRIMPALEYLRIVTVGPDLELLQSKFPSEGRPLNFAENDECPIRDSCDARIVRRPGYYHELNGLDEVNIVVACHSGLHDERYKDRWMPTLEVLASKGVPCCFTAYNQAEALADAKVLDNVNVEILVPPTANPFRGLRPFSDPSRDPSDFIYSNAHYFVFRGVVGPGSSSATDFISAPRHKESTPPSEAVKAAYQMPILP
uniref:MYND-type domain-containing protein n=1 Tax=Odontella aurita TaxID=265563 RepID=A0A7S4N1K1_9STRA|mmetsp:Transcript_43240/g.131633  ORF Transcript_43240/g.131633 Transcript_43240/m.131633 type:complete len:569 (+) Transcript_43240:146-1852(+)